METNIENDFWLTPIEGARFPGEIRGFAAQGTLDAGITWTEISLKPQNTFGKHTTARGGTVDKPKFVPEIDYEDQTRKDADASHTQRRFSAINFRRTDSSRGDL